MLLLFLFFQIFKFSRHGRMLRSRSEWRMAVERQALVDERDLLDHLEYRLRCHQRWNIPCPWFSVQVSSHRQQWGKDSMLRTFGNRVSCCQLFCRFRILLGKKEIIVYVINRLYLQIYGSKQLTEDLENAQLVDITVLSCNKSGKNNIICVVKVNHHMRQLLYIWQPPHRIRNWVGKT